MYGVTRECLIFAYFCSLSVACEWLAGIFLTPLRVTAWRFSFSLILKWTVFNFISYSSHFGSGASAHNPVVSDSWNRGLFDFYIFRVYSENLNEQAISREIYLIVYGLP